MFSDKQVLHDEDKFVSNIEISNIEQITILRPASDADEIKIHKEKNQWFISSPVKTRASTDRVSAILGLLRSKSFARVDTAKSILELYQLQPANITLILDQYKFEFGATDPLDNRRYLLFNNTVHLINDSLYPQLLQSPTFFVSSRLLPEGGVIETIRFKDQAVSQASQHQALSTSGEVIDKKALEQLAQAWQGIQARQVRNYRPVEHTRQVIVGLRSGRTLQFEVVSLSQYLVLARSDLKLEYYLDANSAKILFLTDEISKEKI